MPRKQEKLTESDLGFNHTLRLFLSKNELESPELIPFLGQKLREALRKYRKVRVIIEDQEPVVNRD